MRRLDELGDSLGDHPLEHADGRRIATSYPGIVRAHLDRAGVPAEVVKLDGAVEISIELGVADVIADVVETGSTLRQAGLELIGSPILESEAVVIRRRDPEPAAGTDLAALIAGAVAPADPDGPELASGDVVVGNTVGQG